MTDNEKIMKILHDIARAGIDRPILEVDKHTVFDLSHGPRQDWFISLHGYLQNHFFVHVCRSSVSAAVDAFMNKVNKLEAKYGIFRSK